MFLALVQSTVTPLVHAVASASPSVSPSVTPHVVHAAQTVAQSNSLTDVLNALASRVSVADLMAFAGFVVVAFQYLVNQVPFIKNLSDQVSKTFNWVVSFLLPLLTAFLASVVSGNNDLHLAPYLYLTAQFIYFVVEYIRRKAAPAPAVTATTDASVQF